MISKTVSSVTPDARSRMAQFFLSDEQVIAIYHNAWFEKSIRRGAVCTSSGKTLRPEDGTPFFDALDKAFANSSTVEVVTDRSATRVDAVEIARTVHDRLDAGESARVRALVDAAKEHMRSAMHPTKIEALAQKFAQQTSTFQRIQLGHQTKAAFGVEINPGGDRKVATQIDNFVQHNVSLIQTIPARLSDKIEGMVQHAVTTGSLSSELGDDIKDLGDSVEGAFAMSEKHARFIARDQTGKLMGQIAKARHESLGVTKFYWRSSEDERVRGDPKGLYPKAEPSHFELDGQLFDYDDPPQPDGADAPILPGEDYQCRCTGEPDLDSVLGDEEDDQGDDTSADDVDDQIDQPDDTGDQDLTDLVDE